MRTLLAGLAIGLLAGWWIGRTTSSPEASAPPPGPAKPASSAPPRLEVREDPWATPPAATQAAPSAPRAEPDIAARLRDGSFSEVRAAAQAHTAWTEAEVDALIGRVEEAHRMRHRTWFEGLLGLLAATQHPRAIRYVLDAGEDADRYVVLAAEKAVEQHLMECDDPRLAEAAMIRVDDPRRPRLWRTMNWAYIAGRWGSSEARERLLAHAPWESRLRAYMGWMAAEPSSALAVLRRALADPEIARGAHLPVVAYMSAAGPAAVPVLEDALRELEDGRPAALGLGPRTLIRLYLVPSAEFDLDHRLRFVIGLRREQVRLLAAAMLPDLLGALHDRALVDALAREPGRVLRRLSKDGVRSDEDRELLKVASEQMDFARLPLLNEENLDALEGALPLLGDGEQAMRERVEHLRALLEDPDAWR